jgi:hypothetical protein
MSDKKPWEEGRCPMTDPTKLSIEAIREHLADVEREYDRMARSHDQLATDVRRLWDANQALVQALLAVEWVTDNDPEWGGVRCCPACASVEGSRHGASCVSDAALRKAGVR